MYVCDRSEQKHARAEWRCMKMLQPDLQNKTISSPDDGRAPIPAPVPGQPNSRGVRTGTIIVLTVLLGVVFGVGLFAGWTFAVSVGTSTGTVQTRTDTGATVPPLTGSNREAVVAKVRPAVVQINVVTPRGQGLGSGVIIDQRGYIATNHHVVDGAQRLEVVLYDGTKLPAQ